MTDREKKIAEIREALKKASSWGLKSTPWIVVNAPEWLRFLLSELDRLKREIESHGPEGRNYTNQQVVELRLERERLIEENRKLREERDHIESVSEGEIERLHEQLQSARQDRDKLIEGLRWYANADYVRRTRHDVENGIEFHGTELELDKGQRARDILKEIGVNIDE